MSTGKDAVVARSGLLVRYCRKETRYTVVGEMRRGDIPRAFHRPQSCSRIDGRKREKNGSEVVVVVGLFWGR